MKIIAYLNEPAKYTVKLTEEVYQKLKVEYFFDLRNTQHNNKSFDFQFLREMAFPQRWKLYLQNWNKADIIISNGYLFDWFIFSFFLNLITFKWKPIAIESDTIYRRPQNVQQLTGMLVKNFFFRFPFVYGFAAGNYEHKDYFTKNGMNRANVFLMPWVSLNYNFEKKILNNTFTFLFVGRFIELKNIPNIIEEFILAFGNDGQFQLRLVGDGPLLESISMKYRDHKNIHFPGKLFNESLETEFKSADVLVLASSSENWGLVVNEALSAGLPVLISKFVGSKNDLVQGKGTGMVFNPQKEENLADCMRLISANKELYYKYSNNAKKLMHFEWNYEFYRKCFVSATNTIYKRHYL